VSIVNDVWDADAPEAFLNKVLEYAAQFTPPNRAAKAVGHIKRAVQTGWEIPIAEGLAVPTDGWDFSWFQCTRHTALCEWLAAMPDVELLTSDPDAAKTLYVTSLPLTRPGKYEVLGMALLDGRLVAAASARMIVIADESKLVGTLGHFPLPIEINRFGLRATEIAIARAASASNGPYLSSIHWAANASGVEIASRSLESVTGRVGASQALNTSSGIRLRTRSRMCDQASVAVNSIRVIRCGVRAGAETLAAGS
jgi:hypothetical protein